MTDPKGPGPQPPDGGGRAPEATDDKPVGELLGDMTSGITTLLRKEVEMAVAEIWAEMLGVERPRRAAC